MEDKHREFEDKNRHIEQRLMYKLFIEPVDKAIKALLGRVEPLDKAVTTDRSKHKIDMEKLDKEWNQFICLSILILDFLFLAWVGLIIVLIVLLH